MYSGVAPRAKDLLRETCAFPADLRIANLRHAVVRSLVDVPPSLRELLPAPPSDAPPFRIALGALLDPFGSADSVLLLEDLVEQAQAFDEGMAWAEAWKEFGAGMVPRAECPDEFLDSLRHVLVASLETSVEARLAAAASPEEVIFGFRSFGVFWSHMTDVRALANVARHLRPDGAGEEQLAAVFDAVGREGADADGYLRHPLAEAFVRWRVECALRSVDWSALPSVADRVDWSADVVRQTEEMLGDAP